MSSPSRKRRTIAVTLSSFALLSLALGYATYRLIPSRTTQLAGELVQRVDTQERVVALTFDDGPTDADASTVLDALASRHVTATFYLNGREIVANPDATARVIADGHEIGNHPSSVKHEADDLGDALRSALVD